VPLDGGVDMLVLGVGGLQCQFQLPYPLRSASPLLLQIAALQRQQLGAAAPLLGLEFLVPLRRPRLALQVLEMTLKLLAQIAQALEVLQGPAHAVFRLPTAFLVFGYSRRLLDKDAQFLRARLDQAGDHALLYNRVAARPQPRAQENIGDIAAPAAGAVEVILRLALAADLAFDADLPKARVLATDLAVAVVKDQLDGRLPHGLPVDRAVEDDIAH